MNILILGGGGREHTLAWKINQSKLCDKLFIAPGNAGTAQCGTNISIPVTDFEKISSFCLSNNIKMVVVGPEEPLVKGIYDFFKENPGTAHIKLIGPSKDAAQLEGSKAFAKAFMHRNNIPTAAYREFDSTNFEEGTAYIKSHSLPIVLKADGLASGKGVIICQNHIEALAEFELMLHQSKFGDASKKVVVEEFLTGIELSVFVLTDGEHYLLLPEAKDYKRIGKKDLGPNTGGMGAVSPVPFADEQFLEKIKRQIIEPTISGLQNEKLDYSGIIFIGVIKVGNDPFVIEYNCRFGDPETEVVIPRIKNDLVSLFLATAEKRLNEIEIETDMHAAVTIVAVSEGYPNQYETGRVIKGLDDPPISGTIIFHSGTIKEGTAIKSNGGRVLAITSFGETIKEASEKSVFTLEQVFFEGMYYRDDIGYEFKGSSKVSHTNI